MVIGLAEPVPKFETMVVSCFRRMTEGITCAYPEVSKKTVVDKLITSGSEQGSHVGQFSVAAAVAVIIII